jgi:CRP/FNR family transcriptional regulator, cyclic AMP receptor protein
MERDSISPDHLYPALEQCCERVNKSKWTVLFRRGEKAYGMFLVIRGTVKLDFGVDCATALGSNCGPGALVGLPATLSGGNYSMTATVTEDAELGLVSSPMLVSLLRKNPELCQQLLSILSAKIDHTDQVRRAMLGKENMPRLQSRVA